MPQGLTVPAWYNDDHYISEKVDECNTIKFGDQSDWNADSVKAALASAFGEETYAPWMGYDNFVSNGNAENCSPSQYFVVSEYLAAKAAQLNEIQYEDKTDWDQAKVLDAFRAANISAWDHYTTTGQQEGINPSNAFDNDAFFTAKCAILNAWQNKDGTVGYEGKDDWTKDDVIAVFQSLGINPIMNQPENPDAASLVIKAENPVDGGNFNPWNPTGATEYNDIPLVAGQTEYPGTDGNDNFIGAVPGASNDVILQRDDLIDGGSGQDKLTLAMSSDWNGFNNRGGMTNVETVDLNNTGTRAHNFNASGIDGAQTYNLNGNLTLSNLAAGVAVNMANYNANTAATIGFAKDVVAGNSDTLDLGIENMIGRNNSPINVKAAGVETLNLDVEGKSNAISLVTNSDLGDLGIKGNGNLRISEVNAGLETIVAEDAAGNLNIDASAATVIESATLGSGDDTLVVQDLALRAPVDGGDGSDTLVLQSAAKSSYYLQMTNVENLTVKDNNHAVALGGNDIDGLETLTVKNTNSDITLEGYTDTSSLNVVAQGTVGPEADILVAEMDTVNFTVGDNDRETADRFLGTIALPDTSTLDITVLDGTSTGPASFNGVILGGGIDEVNINTATNNSTFNLKNGSDLDEVGSVSVKGFGGVNLGDNFEMGSDADSLNVDAGQLYADFAGSFKANANVDQVLDITGTHTGSNGIAVTGSYDSVTYTGSTRADVINLNGFTPDSNGQYAFDLDGGLNIVLGGTEEQLSSYINSDTAIKYFAGNTASLTGSDVNGESLEMAPGSNLAINASDVKSNLNLTGIDFASGSSTFKITGAQDKAVINLGDTPDSGAEITGAWSGNQVTITDLTVNLTESGTTAYIDSENFAVNFTVNSLTGGNTAYVDLGRLNSGGLNNDGDGSSSGHVPNLVITKNTIDKLTVGLPTDLSDGNWFTVYADNFQKANGTYFADVLLAPANCDVDIPVSNPGAAPTVGAKVLSWMNEAGIDDVLDGSVKFTNMAHGIFNNAVEYQSLDNEYHYAFFFRGENGGNTAVVLTGVGGTRLNGDDLDNGFGQLSA